MVGGLECGENVYAFARGLVVALMDDGVITILFAV